jgi:hypothetical protein
MEKEFSLGDVVPGFPSDARILVDATSSAAVFDALLNNQPFPAGLLSLGSIAADFKTKSSTPIETDIGTVSFEAKAGGGLSIVVLDTSEAVLQRLALPSAKEIGLRWPDLPNERYMVLLAAFRASTSIKATHPVGTLGAATFGVEAGAGSTYAIVSRFDQNAGAADALTALLRNWRLPATLKEPNELDSSATIVFSMDGSLGLRVGAQLGYDFSFVRAVKAGGLSGDLGVKVAAKLTTQVGISVSGQFLVCLDRPAEHALRVRLFKLAKRGWKFGLNLTVGATGQLPNVPEKFDDFVKLVFGTHGEQIISDLRKIEQWTDPTQSTGELVAGLAKDEALAFLKDVTGFDARTEFTQARDRLLAGIRQWHDLPTKTSSWLWSELAGGLTADDQTKLKGALAVLAAPSDDGIRAFIAKEIAQAGFEQSIVGRLLGSIAEDGVLALLDQTPEVRAAAIKVQSLLDGEFLQNLQTAIETRLNLDQVLKAVNATDWNAIDQWLKTRLSDFFGEELGFNRLDQVRGAIQEVLKKRQTLFAAVREAATRTYEAKFSAAYETATTRTALIDATFDFSEQPARNAYSALVRSGDWGALFTEPIPGVAMGQGVLTHGIARRTDVQVTLPMLPEHKLTAITSSLAKLSIESDGSTVVGTYDLAASSDVTLAGRFASKVTLAARASVLADDSPGLRRHGNFSGTWNYLYRFGKLRASLGEMAALLDPIQRSYFAAKFGAEGSDFTTWLVALDRTIEDQLQNGPNNFGDVLVGLELLLKDAFLETWFEKRDAAARRAAVARASLAVQRSLRAALLAGYTADLSKINVQAGTCALLVYASLDPANHLVLSDGKLLSSDKKPYWDFVDKKLVSALARTEGSLERLIVSARALANRLNAGDAQSRKTAEFFAESPASVLIQRAIPLVGEFKGPLLGLLMNEAEIVSGIGRALEDIARFTAAQSKRPAEALQALARFGATITETFNKKVRSIYGTPSIRTIGTDLLGEVTQAIDPAVVSEPQARLMLLVLNPAANFDLRRFLEDGVMPAPEEVALSHPLTAGFMA